jgi:hypothetical protein
MLGDWSQEIRREYTGGEVRFDFPPRPLGKAKLIGVVLIGFGILFAWSPAREVWHTIQKWLHETPNSAEKFFSLFQLPFLIAGLVPVALGLLILFGRCRVEWRDGQLRAGEILGPLRWMRPMPRKPIRKLEVAAATSTSGTSAPRQVENFSGLAVVFEDGSKKLLVLGYPKDWVLGVAQELKTYVGGETPAFAAAKVEVVESSPQNENDADVPDQPAGSKVRVETQVSGLHLTVPPAGLWRGSKGLFFFALLWCGFMTVFTTLVVRSPSKQHGDLWIFILFIVGFWAIGLGMLAAAMNMGRRTAEFVAETGRLRVEIKGLFGIKQHEWSRDEIAAIRADRSGMEVNNRPVIELQIHPRAGKKVGLLAGQNENELRWMATRLRRTLNVPARNT